jgi:hypothetical protein
MVCDSNLDQSLERLEEDLIVNGETSAAALDVVVVDGLLKAVVSTHEERLRPSKEFQGECIENV